MPTLETNRQIEPLLALRGLVKHWGADRAPVLDGLELSLEPGTTAHVFGPNGVGKTTFLRVAAGLILAERGTVSLGGLSPDTATRLYQRRIGFLSAGNTGLYARLSAQQHLDFSARLALVGRAARPGLIQRSLERFDLYPLRTRRLDRISMGERQRVRLAMAFLHEPDVLLLDEPQTSLDDVGLQILASALDGTRDAGGAAICCSATSETGELGFDSRYLLTGGRLVAA